MKTIRVTDFLHDRILISRDSARTLAEPLTQCPDQDEPTSESSGASSVVVDFLGVDGVSPSFMDELIRVFEEILKTRPGSGFSLTIQSPPTRLSTKFEAIARSHGLNIRLNPQGSWVLSAQQAANSHEKP